jgi:tripartite-type tricarboxylate transporter receptor subunit TctC
MLEDVHPITYLNQVNMAFITKAGGANSIEDLIVLSKQRPINVGISTASGTFLSENLFKHLNVPYQIIPYKNNTGAVVDIMNGNLDVAVDTLISAKQLTENERVQIITSTLDRKSAGKYKHKSIDRYNSQLAGIPLGIILSVNPTVGKEDKVLLAKLVNMCNNDNEIIDKLERVGSAPVYLNTDEIRQLIKQASK